jgi:hypothetical protein
MRYYTEITKEEFLLRVKDVMDNEEFPYEMPPSIIKDISKVSFDFENYTNFTDTSGFADYPVGHKEIKPGFHVFFINAGGDWEFPVCFIIYWGDCKLRGYVPKNGNVWNKKTKCAYDDEDHKNEYDEREMFKDILKNIKEKK